jgi:hypothetical protein
MKTRGAQKKNEKLWRRVGRKGDWRQGIKERTQKERNK